MRSRSINVALLNAHTLSALVRLPVVAHTTRNRSANKTARAHLLAPRTGSGLLFSPWTSMLPAALIRVPGRGAVAQTQAS
jgi:hypothetical protein